MADEKLRSYRRHSEKPWELEPELSEHRSAMTIEALHSKAEIAEELAVRDRKIAALEARAEKAERERDEALALIKRLQNECDGWCKTHAERRDERDAALARVRELEESNSVMLVGGRIVGKKQARLDAEELAAFRWLMQWLREKDDQCVEYSLAREYGDFAIVLCGNLLHKMAPTIPDLATALDPNWRKAGSKKD